MKNTQINSETTTLINELGLEGTFSQEGLQKYFLEQKSIIVSVGKFSPGKFFSKAISFNKYIGYFILTTNSSFSSKTEALEEGLQLTIKRLINGFESKL